MSYNGASQVPSRPSSGLIDVAMRASYEADARQARADVLKALIPPSNTYTRENIEFYVHYVLAGEWLDS